MLLRSGCSYAEVPGYFQSGPKVRRTVTLQNLFEVSCLFVSLVYKIHFVRRQEFCFRPTRVQIDFAAAVRGGGGLGGSAYG
jgi:hypothetical protein